MSDYAMFHALGQGEQLDPNDPQRTTQPAAQTFVPPIAQQQYQQQQQYPPQQAPPPAGYGAPAPPLQHYPGQQQPPYMGTASPAGQGFGAPPPAAGLVGGDGGLAAQMGGMTLGGDPNQYAAAAAHRKKKKDRHAYHTVEAPVGGSFSAAAMSAQPEAAGGIPGAPGFDNNGVTPQMSQFPTPANGPFNPAQPADPASFAARGASAGGDAGPAPAIVPASGQQKVSADDIPSVPLSRDSVQPHFLTNVYPTFERHVPPPASISFVAFDQGNSSPKYTRLTMNNIPASPESLKETGLPLGLLLQPLAPTQAGELPVPVLDFGDAGPPRCRRCRAYINPFMVFRSGGNKYVCNLCTYPNDTPPEYFCATSPQGVRTDRDQRPELSRGTVEFVVPKEYWTREPVGLRWLFVIDVTQESYNRGFLEAFCDGILGALYSEEVGEDGEPKRSVPEGARVGFVTYDKEVHFYNVNVSVFSVFSVFSPARIWSTTVLAY